MASLDPVDQLSNFWKNPPRSIGRCEYLVYDILFLASNIALYKDPLCIDTLLTEEEIAIRYDDQCDYWTYCSPVSRDTARDYCQVNTDFLGRV